MARSRTRKRAQRPHKLILAPPAVLREARRRFRGIQMSGDQRVFTCRCGNGIWISADPEPAFQDHLREVGVLPHPDADALGGDDGRGSGQNDGASADGEGADPDVASGGKDEEPASPGDAAGEPPPPPLPGSEGIAQGLHDERVALDG